MAAAVATRVGVAAGAAVAINLAAGATYVCDDAALWPFDFARVRAELPIDGRGATLEPLARAAVARARSEAEARARLQNELAAETKHAASERRAASEAIQEAAEACEAAEAKLSDANAKLDSAMNMKVNEDDLDGMEVGELAVANKLQARVPPHRTPRTTPHAHALPIRPSALLSFSLRTAPPPPPHLMLAHPPLTPPLPCAARHARVARQGDRGAAGR